MAVRLLALVRVGGTDDEGDDTDAEDAFLSSAQQDATREWKEYSDFRKKRYQPEYGPGARSLGQADSLTIKCGEPIKQGENLPSGNNLSDYIDGKGYCNVVALWVDHRDYFPRYYKLAMKRASHLMMKWPVRPSLQPCWFSFLSSWCHYDG
jgi:hypothetical protein